MDAYYLSVQWEERWLVVRVALDTVAASVVIEVPDQIAAELLADRLTAESFRDERNCYVCCGGYGEHFERCRHYGVRVS
jgi:hypothetical protein